MLQLEADEQQKQKFTEETEQLLSQQQHLRDNLNNNHGTSSAQSSAINGSRNLGLLGGGRNSNQLGKISQQLGSPEISFLKPS